MAHRIIGKNKAGAIITIGRSDSDGLEGTHRNIDHHAQNLKTLVHSLMPVAKTADIREWRQFNNVHYFFCHTGKILYFQGYKANGEYIGIEFGIKYFGLKVPLFLYTDTSQLLEFWQLIATMISEPNLRAGAVEEKETACEEAKV